TNCSNNFGPFANPEKFIPLVVTNLILGKKVPIYGDGKYVRDWLYVEDHVRAIELILTKGGSGQTYCVGGMTEEVNNLELVGKILKIMGKSEEELEFVKDRPGHDRRYAVDWSKINRELGWEPKHDFETWLEKTVIWYQEHEDWWRKLCR
ncbi:GDP-mannose 4,6-dehydratase, partial [Patescibacteria group bacterium]|nr:GDP-mannose 4,6-dehydratase [Patescibacteria group bacterium]